MKKLQQQKENISKEYGMQVVLALDLGLRIEMEDKVRTLIEVTERLDYGKLTGTYQRQPRRGETTPKQMFQLVVLGFMEERYSTRKMKSSCLNDIRFMYILHGNKAPSHNKLGRFIKEHLGGEVAEDLFYQLVLLLKERGEIDFKNLFPDGTKIEANANRYSFVWAKSTGKLEARLNEKLNVLLERLSTEYALIIDENKPEAYQKELKERARGLTFVHGRGKRKAQLQRDIEELEEYLIRREKYQTYNAIFKGRNSFSKADPDATFMRMKEDHMKNGQLKPAYNLLLGVEAEYIVGVDLSSERSDELTLLPLLYQFQSLMRSRNGSFAALPRRTRLT